MCVIVKDVLILSANFYFNAQSILEQNLVYMENEIYGGKQSKVTMKQILYEIVIVE